MSQSPRFTPVEFFATHADNMRGDVLFDQLPFYIWLDSLDTPQHRFVDALTGYYAGHTIKGAFTDDEIHSYRNIYNHFWYVKYSRAAAGAR